MGINFGKFIENRVNNIKASDKLAFASAIGVGPWVTPAAPAIIFGYSLWKSVPGDMGIFRIITAVAVAVGLVVAGAVSSHNAVLSKDARSWMLVVGYIFLEVIGLWMMAVSFEVKVVGTVASLLTLIVYLSRTDANEIDAAKDREELAKAKEEGDEDQTKADAKSRDQAEFEFKVEQDRLDAAHYREMDAREVESKHAAKLARIEAESGQMTGSNDRVKVGQGGSNDRVKKGQMTGSNSENDPPKVKVKERQERIADLMLDHTKPEIARILGVSLSTVKRDVRDLNNGKLE